MEKIIYLVWRRPSDSVDGFAQRLRTELAAPLQQAGVHALQVNVADAAVALAAQLKQTHTDPPIEALVSVWVDSAVARFRAPIEQLIAAQGSACAGYLVTESQPLRNMKHLSQPGTRTEGFAQVALLKRPARLDYAQWLDVWHNFHTGVALETQSTFEYTQNVVVRTLTPNAPAFDAIVEECFPAAAMTDPFTFFDALGDEAKFRRNLDRMMDSVGRFIDMGMLDVVPTSQYRLFSKRD
ncbi:MAG: hypothetical protein JWR16_1860 [Nevskia sp.]|nr:hypothetical protein [Nevskia sp.]